MDGINEIEIQQEEVSVSSSTSEGTKQAKKNDKKKPKLFDHFNKEEMKEELQDISTSLHFGCGKQPMSNPFSI